MLEREKIRVVQLNKPDKVLSVIQKSFSEGDPFDICIIDILMPVISGFDVARQVRGLDSPMSDLPLLAFSSSTMSRSGKLKEAGFDGFQPKPIRRKRLLKIIESLIGNKESRKDKTQEERIVTQYSIVETAKHSIRILLAEDNPINQKLIHFMLTKAGYQVNIVENGKQAVETYTSEPDGFDLIFMDVQMPEMDGKDAAAAIRNKGFKNIPIIAMTAETMKGDREKCLEAGMNDYISKPIKREVVFEMVKKWCLDEID